MVALGPFTTGTSAASFYARNQASQMESYKKTSSSHKPASACNYCLARELASQVTCTIV